MTQQFAIALLSYLNRCVHIIPTTAVEWEAISPNIKTLELLAQGRIEIKIEEKKFPQPSEATGDRGAGA